MKKIVLLCLLLLLTFGNTASAANWQYAVTMRNGTLVFFDSETLRINEYNYLDAWSKWVFPPTLKIKGSYQIYHLEFSQTPRRLKVLSYYTYDANNKLINQSTRPSFWDDIIPGTYSESFYRKLVQCYKDKTTSEAQTL